MTPERWQHIDKLFHSALERPPQERALFLEEACEGDTVMRTEVEALIAAHEQSGEFLDAPALAVGSEKLTIDGNQLAANQTVGHYRILGLLGAGGMGEVYLAEDSRLRRKIALKLLPGEFTKDGERLRRFEQEARAASALSHPNVCVIHEIGETEDGRNFIAMEYIEGVTLRQRLAQKRLKLIEALELATQIAAGLATAHAAGIVHRDIKPENVMLRADGLVKILDFGLAKLTERQPSETDTESLLRSLVQTGSGTIMGTVAYMSPEQARGLRMDARSDIWSLGVVLYEMVAGQPPFSGPTPSDMLVSILDREPLPLSVQSDGVPAELERIVGKTLEKEMEERYQVVKDLALDLKSLRRELEAAREHSLSPEVGEGKQTASTTEPLVTGTSKKSGARTNGEGSAYPTTSAEYLVSEIKQHKQMATLLLTGLFVTVAGLGYGLYRLIEARTSSGKTIVPFQTFRTTRLTTSGNVETSAISPDGRYVVYETEENGKYGLWLRQVDVASTLRLLPPEEKSHSGLMFSRDGNYVYYYTPDEQGRNVLYQVTVLGQATKKIVTNVTNSVGFSADGGRMAFYRWKSPSEQALMIVNADGTGEHELASRKGPFFYNWFPLSGPAWSPNGKVLACPTMGMDQGQTKSSIVAVNVADGTENSFAPQHWEFISQVAWLADGNGLLVTTRDRRSAFFQVWYVSYPAGEARPVTSDLGDHYDVSLTADGRTLSTVSRTPLENVWLAPRGNVGRAQQITSGFGEYDSLSWTPDGKIVYNSSASGSTDVWEMAPDGTGQRQLTSHAGLNNSAAVSPDGRYVVFHSNRSGTNQIWRIDRDGGNPQQLTKSATEAILPQVSPDGNWVIYNGGGLWKVPIIGGIPVRLIEKFSTLQSAYSPDGKHIGCWYWQDDDRAHPRLAVISEAGGEPLRLFDPPPGWSIPDIIFLPRIRWMADGHALTYPAVRNGVSNIWKQPLDGGKPTPVTNFNSDWIFSFDWSRDGHLIYSRGLVSKDVMLIQDRS